MPNAYILNQVPTTYGQAVSLIAEMLVQAGWVYRSSGDGAAGYSATGKIFTGTGAGAGGWGNVRAWARLAAPDDRREICIQHNNAAGIRLKYSALAKFIGGTPSANVVPSATDERVMWGSGTDATPTQSAWFSTAILTTGNRFYGHASNVAPYGFWVGAIALPGGAVTCGMMLDAVISVPEDPDPVVMHIGTTNAFFRALGNQGSTSVTLPAAWPSPGGTQQGSWAHMDPSMTSFVYVMANLFAFGYMYNDSSNTAVFVGGSVIAPLNPFNGKHEALPTMWGRPSVPITNTGLKGWSTFLRWTTIPRTSGLDTLDGLKWICMGSVWLPWDGVTTPIN